MHLLLKNILLNGTIKTEKDFRIFWILNLITECEKLYIKLEDLLTLYKVKSLDDITFRQYDNMIKNWDKIVLQLNNFF